MDIQKPTVGRIVLYTDSLGEESAAIVSRVLLDGSVNLNVFWSGPRRIEEWTAREVAGLECMMAAGVRQRDPDALDARRSWRWPPRT